MRSPSHDTLTTSTKCIPPPPAAVAAAGLACHRSQGQFQAAIPPRPIHSTTNSTPATSPCPSATTLLAPPSPLPLLLWLCCLQPLAERLVLLPMCHLATPYCSSMPADTPHTSVTQQLPQTPHAGPHRQGYCTPKEPAPLPAAPAAAYPLVTPPAPLLLLGA